MQLIDRYIGSLLGLAAGDALGTTLEFSSPRSSTFVPVTTIVGGGPFRLKPGEWTDDTSMALCLAESLIQKKEFDAADQKERYLMWFEQGYLSSTGECFDIGNTTKQALLEYKNDAILYATNISEANGSLMRLAPIPLAYFRKDKEIALYRAAQSSKVTHGGVEAMDACIFVCDIICRLLNGLPKEYALKRDVALDDIIQSNSINMLRDGSYKELTRETVLNPSGYVVPSLQAALWAFYNSGTFEEGALMAVNLGNDSDTVGAIYGQIAGAYYGKDGIPEEWRNILVRRSYIEELASQLYELDCK